MLTSTGHEFTVGPSYWNSGTHEYRTPVEVRDGDKIISLTVCTPGSVRKDQVQTCVEKSMQQWNYWGEAKAKPQPLKGGV